MQTHIKETSKSALLALCDENSPVIGEFPAQCTSDAEKVSMWWRHNAETLLRYPSPMGTTHDLWLAMIFSLQGRHMRDMSEITDKSTVCSTEFSCKHLRKISKVRLTGLLWGESTGDRFPALMTTHAESVTPIPATIEIANKECLSVSGVWPLHKQSWTGRRTTTTGRYHIP